MEADFTAPYVYSVEDITPERVQAVKEAWRRAAAGNRKVVLGRPMKVVFDPTKGA